jgi:hypothetical protein
LDQWASMRSSWTDNDTLFVAVKAGKNQGHHTHNDLDTGDFVLDAAGQTSSDQGITARPGISVAMLKIVTAGSTTEK